MWTQACFRYWLVLVFGILFFNAAFAQDDKENKLVEFKGFGQWEIWCIDIKQAGNVECNLNHVLRYKNHPDFRAMIFRFYSDGDQVTRMVIDHEWQTSFVKGNFQVDDYGVIDLSNCSKQCELEGQQLIKIIEQFSSGDKATIRFHDYLIQEFEEHIPINNIVEALQNLNEMQARFN